jgi:hypothetical protein
VIDRDRPWMFAISGLPREEVDGVPLVSGLEARTISRAADGACTLEVHLPAGWGGRAEPRGRLDLFVLEGELTVAGEPVCGGGFATLPLGETPVAVVGGERARAIMIWGPGRPARAAGQSPHVASAWDRLWETNTQPGTPFGLMRRRLREDDAGPPQGPAGGWVRLVHVVPGWCTDGEERHAGCWEENILLRGDVYMADRGAAIRTGDCLANPPGHWHGPMATKGGALFLVHCDAAMGVELRDEGAHDEALKRYLVEAPWP